MELDPPPPIAARPPSAPLRIEGGGVALRPFAVGDLAAWARWQQPGHAWQALDGPYYPRPGPEQLAAQLAKIRARLESSAPLPSPPRRLAIVDPDDALLGTVSWYWISQETHWPALGIALYDPARWGRGLGYAALGLWCDHLLAAEPEFARLDLRTWSGNRGMMRLAEKLGFREEARFRDARLVDGRRYDGMGYGVLRAEWAARYPGGFRAHLDARR